MYLNNLLMLGLHQNSCLVRWSGLMSGWVLGNQVHWPAAGSSDMGSSVLVQWLCLTPSNHLFSSCCVDGDAAAYAFLADDSVLDNKNFMIILLMVLWLVFSFCCGNHQTNCCNHLRGQLSTPVDCRLLSVPSHIRMNIIFQTRTSNPNYWNPTPNYPTRYTWPLFRVGS